MQKPTVKPKIANFSSGPCAKRPGWTPAALENAFLGRSHRAKEGTARIHTLIDTTHQLLKLPDDYRLAIVPASDTGAFELAMWSLLGPRGIDVLAWESFGHGWVSDINNQLRLKDVRVIKADYGKLPDLNSVDFSRDVVFTWNGTTSGVRVPNSDWIANDRTGLTLVDATSAVFAQPIDWTKTDIVTFSWQKVLGGEAAHGMLVLSPRAVKRLESHQPTWPMPKLFRLTKAGKLNESIFKGQTINTPSMLCVEDCLDALNWVHEIGGLEGMITRANANAAIIHNWIAKTPWIENLAQDPATWSNTSVCLKICDETVSRWPPAEQVRVAKTIVKLLEVEAVAYDIGSYRDAPAGLRIWTGATVDKDDLSALTHWLTWAFHKARTEVEATRRAQ